MQYSMGMPLWLPCKGNCPAKNCKLGARAVRLSLTSFPVFSVTLLYYPFRGDHWSPANNH